MKKKYIHVNERKHFKGVDLKKRFRESILPEGFREIAPGDKSVRARDFSGRKIRVRKTTQSDSLEGTAELTFAIENIDKDMEADLYTSVDVDTNEFREHDQLWPLIRRTDMRNYHKEPFHLPPLNRTENVFENTQGRVYACRIAINHWPICQHCKSRLGWAIVPVKDNDEEERYVQVRNRIIWCDKPGCPLKKKDVGILASNISFPDKKATRLFRKPFIDDIQMRRRLVRTLPPEDWPKPKITTRASSLQSAVAVKKKRDDFNDLENEKTADFHKSAHLYNDVQNESRQTYTDE